MKVTVNIKDTNSLTSLDYFFILLIKIFDNMNDEESYKWFQDNVSV